MTYRKTMWHNGGAPGISAERLNKIEEGIHQSHEIFDLFTDGYFVGIMNELEVKFGTSSAVNVESGKAVAKGIVHEQVETGLSTSVGNTPTRYERVVLRFNLVEGKATLESKLDFGGPPTLQRDSTIWELSLAQIVPSDEPGLVYEVVDERNDSELCGMAIPPVEVIIKKGSNQYGNYVLYPNGWMVVNREITIDLNTDSSQSFGMPALFKEGEVSGSFIYEDSAVHGIEHSATRMATLASVVSTVRWDRWNARVNSNNLTDRTIKAHVSAWGWAE